MQKLIFIFSLILTVVVYLISSTSSYAKELPERLGVGYSNQFSEELPSLALRYYPDPKLGVGLALGIDTDDGNSKFGFMARLYRIIFPEDNMNFYMGTGAGIVTIEKNNDSDSGFELSGFCGGEFFFTGLENLGFSFEAGIGVTSIDSQVRFRTIGDHPLKAGVIFYF